VPPAKLYVKRLSSIPERKQNAVLVVFFFSRKEAKSGVSPKERLNDSMGFYGRERLDEVIGCFI
jgi:hypothetical protein